MRAKGDNGSSYEEFRGRSENSPYDTGLLEPKHQAEAESSKHVFVSHKK